ncbi:MAG: hypothetical protein LUE99_17265 [Bacteroides sp.]|nr:hypothetical protein [Bacteroides sp.]
MGDSFITVRGLGLQDTTHPGDPDDRTIRSLRVLSFDHATGNRTTNVRYNAWLGDVVRHTILLGTYDLVFLANEPLLQDVVTALEGVSEYNDLKKIAYPADCFTSEQVIPMIQVIKNVTVLSNGAGAILGNGTEVSLLELGLDRLGVRVDVVLEAEENFENDFKGIIFSKLPNLVPLIAAEYTGTPIERDGTRTFTRTENGNYFSDEISTTSGANWAKGINRIILPSNELATPGDKAKAVVFTVDMGDNYHPSRELEINPDPVNYSLPINTKLDVLGIIKGLLHVSIQASPWDETANGWDISGNKQLNVSAVEVSITDFNVARISFWSNMPEVKVLPKAYVGTGSEEADTDKIFNDLIWRTKDVKDDGNTVTYTTSRFSYTYNKSEKAGTGYMDVLLDDLNEKGSQKTFRLILSAEDNDGGGKLQREIKVHTSQYDKRFSFNAYGTGYIGAFFRNKEMGERIVTGQQTRKVADTNGYVSPEEIGQIKEWNASVLEGEDFIVLSTTPSFDPSVGTDNPGKAEHYAVRPNEYKGETGSRVEGNGRIYFRIGMKEENKTGAPPLWEDTGEALRW